MSTPPTRRGCSRGGLAGLPGLQARGIRRAEGRGVRGYTLVELMAVVAIVGILAALATYGVQHYMAAAKSGEAKEMVGAIAKAAVAAYERPRNTADAVSYGGEAGGGDPGTSEHGLCGSTIPAWVPGSLTAVKGHKYQPKTGKDADFQKGDELGGWRCLRFAVDQPMTYQLNYSHADTADDWSHTLSGDFFVARAQGDTDADGIASRFLRGGTVINDVVTMQTEVWLQNDTE
jgi:type IV pilus assembly protein PilA